jgi:type 2 lantibiotic biosynthesis protein LanM
MSKIGIKTYLQNPEFYHALNLAERVTLVSQFIKKLPNTQLSTNFVPSNLSLRRMQKWQSQHPFNSSDYYFTQRLAKDGINKDELLYILNENFNPSKVSFTNLPSWLIEFQEAFCSTCSTNSQNFIFSKLLSSQLEAEKSILGFLYIIEPLITTALDQLHKEVQALIKTQQNLPFDPNTIESILFASLPQRLFDIVNRTMALELNIARLQESLTGDTPSERFKSFVERLRQPEFALTLFKEYPVLARQLTICIQHWLKFSIEFLHHLCIDWEAICSTFSPDSNPGLLVALQCDVGDSHRQGRSVIIAQFEHGLQVVYKPKSLSIEVRFQNLLTWLNKHGNHPPFQTTKILNCGSYGWVEFVENHGCTTTEEIERFYQRQGGYLALLYALEANDFHCENLIACGEHPILIDLETLCNPYRVKIDSKLSEMLAVSQMDYSVLRVGLLPQKGWANDESDGVDLSGLAALPGQITPHGVPTWEGTATDEMRLTCKRVEMSVGKNRPTLNGSEVKVLDYTKSIVTGFTSIYQLLLKHRDELLSPDGLIASFNNSEVRVVLRPTYTYTRMLSGSFHPDLLRDALERDKFFDLLWIEVKHRPELEKVIFAEHQDLWQGDVPIFTTRANSCDLWTSTNQKISNFFVESGITSVRKKLQQLSSQDMEQQIWFIRASLATLEIGVAQPAQSLISNLTKPKKIISAQETLSKRLIANALSIGEHLETLALRGEDDTTWLGLNLINERHWSVLPLDADLYDGISGVVLFLAYLGAITQENRYTTLAEVALNTLKSQLKQSQAYTNLVGAFNGLGGLIYTLTHLSILWDKADLISEAEELLKFLPPLIAEDEKFDIIAGAAGCIASLISLYRCKPSETTLATAIQCGDRLINKAQIMKQGLGWVLKGIETKALSGFSHGAAGIAWALLELSALTGQKRFYQTALNAITYERSLFYPKLNNWLDLREYTTSTTKDNQEQHNCMTAWCHGAPGIGLARLRSLPYFDNLTVRAEISTAIKTTLEQGFGFNHSLCHGDLGNLELLLQASLTLNDSECKLHTNRLIPIILESIEKNGWVCGVPLGVETPGLMTGLAGIGYGLLRLAAPERVPSVLMLEPPKLNTTIQKKDGFAIIS